LILINPFKGLRPKKNIAFKISTPSPRYYNNLKLNSAFGYLKILLSKNLNKSKKYFKKMKRKQLIIKENKDSYYIYKISNNSHSQIGIIGRIDLSNYDDKYILGHEETFKKRVFERKKQMLNISAQIGPIYTTYKNNGHLNIFLKKLTKLKPLYSFKSIDKFLHQIWIVNSDKNLKNLKNLIKKIKKIYICDGHHRIQGMIKSNIKVSPMVIAFPHNQIKILDYNRIVKSTLNKDIILKIIRKNFKILKIKKNSKSLKRGVIDMYMNKQWYSLNYLKKKKELDVTILHKKILNKINTKNIDYVSGIKNPKFLKKQVDSKKFNLAFKVFATNIKSVMKIADKKKFMPPKSTWFYPKPLDGLIALEF